jgi:membrane protease YdiL (CAAX protease family)
MSWKSFRLTTRHLGRNILAALMLAVFGWFYFSIYLYWTRNEPIQWSYGGSLPALFVIILVASAEEFFFRGYFQNRLNPRYRLMQRVVIAVVALAFYKNVIHMWEGIPLVFHLELFFLGVLHNILPSLWMEWSDNLVGPLLLHVFWDLLVYAPLGEIPYWVI